MQSNPNSRSSDKIFVNYDILIQNMNSIILQPGQTPEAVAEYYHIIIAKEIVRWVMLYITVTFMLTIVIFAYFLEFDYEYALIPLITLDAYYINLHILLARQSLRDNKCSYITGVIDYSCCFFTTLMFAGMPLFPEPIYTISTVPICVAAILRSFIRAIVMHECQGFSEFVNFTQFFYIGRISRALIVFFVSMKLDGIYDWEWGKALWPMWLTIGFLMITSVASIAATFGALISYCNGECEVVEFQINLFIFFQVGGATAALFFSAIGLIQYLDNHESFLLAVLPTYIYLIVYTLVTLSIHQRLTLAFYKVFINRQIQEQADQQQGRPENRRRAVSQQIFHAIKDPPAALIRLTSTYYQPITGEMLKQRAQSQMICSSEILNTSPQLDPLKGAEASWSIKSCVLCDTNSINAVLMDCGHGGLCYECAIKLMSTSAKCHLCREEIIQVLRVEEDDSNLMRVIENDNRSLGSTVLYSEFPSQQ